MLSLYQLFIFFYKTEIEIQYNQLLIVCFIFQQCLYLNDIFKRKQTRADECQYSYFKSLTS